MLEMNLVVVQYEIFGTIDILGSSGLDLSPRKGGEQGGKDQSPQYRTVVGSLMWRPVMTRPGMANA